jgi:hypothetical protein
MTVSKGGTKHIIHYNRKLGKSRRKTLRKFLSKKRRTMLGVIRKGYKSLKRSKSLKRRMRGGGALTPASIGFDTNSPSGGNNVADSVMYSLADGLGGEPSALANPPIPSRLSGCANK